MNEGPEKLKDPLKILVKKATKEVVSWYNIPSGSPLPDNDEYSAEKLVPYLIERLKKHIPHKPNINPRADEGFITLVHNILGAQGVNPDTAGEIAKVLLTTH